MDYALRQVVGLYRQVVQGWSWNKVDEELRKFGHGRRLRRAHPQISKQLEAGAPACVDALPRPAER